MSRSCKSAPFLQHTCTPQHIVLLGLKWFSVYSHRGEIFRKDFLAIGEARSLVPSHMNMMPLTATAAKTTHYRFADGWEWCNQRL